MSNISVQACSSYSECASQCPNGLPACIGGQCACVHSDEKAAATTEPLPEIVESCFSSCDCKIKCRIGVKICYKNICGCLHHPYYPQPICAKN